MVVKDYSRVRDKKYVVLNFNNTYDIVIDSECFRSNKSNEMNKWRIGGTKLYFR